MIWLWRAFCAVAALFFIGPAIYFATRGEVANVLNNVFAVAFVGWLWMAVEERKARR